MLDDARKKTHYYNLFISLSNENLPTQKLILDSSFLKNNLKVKINNTYVLCAIVLEFDLKNKCLFKVSY